MSAETESSRGVVLVTGSAGFIGYHTASSLLGKGYEVVGVDNLNDYYDVRLKEKRNELLSHFPLYNFYKLDITRHETLKDICKRHSIGHIVHLAAQAGVRYSIDNPWAYAHSNYLGTLSVFELARALKIAKVVYASSSSVYGNAERTPFTENDRVDSPSSFYGATKIANEALAESYYNLYGITGIGLRFFTVYGPSGRPDMAPIIFARAICLGEPIQLFNKGNMMRDFTYISDIVSGIVGALETPGIATGPYNLGAGSPVNIFEFVKLLEEYLGKKARIELMPMQTGDMLKTFSDSSKARKSFGYVPRVSFRDGVKSFCDWFRLAQNELFEQSANIEERPISVVH
ncbi:MAG: NAD-dependent epimerase/dehydratase family protein [Candidatus Vogelbacteria bacterium]|nr:NAD-dependent epimerase/dehydratase family protein [Candidatus Vogelbacteria bacterium]